VRVLDDDVVVVDQVGLLKRRFQIICGRAGPMLLQGCSRLLILHYEPSFFSKNLSEATLSTMSMMMPL